jgi:hypothetical protein
LAGKGSKIDLLKLPHIISPEKVLGIGDKERIKGTFPTVHTA